VDRPEFRGFQDKEGLLAVPIMGRRGLVAVLACRLLRRAVKPEAIPQLLAPRLQRAAAEIAARVPDEVAIAS
jgi:DNA-binding IclR family transcriptional regulator